MNVDTNKPKNNKKQMRKMFNKVIFFSGKLVVIVQSKKQKGDITIKVKDAKRNLKKILILKPV